MGRKTAIVLGATGVVGRRLAEVLVGTGDFEVIGFARRQPADVVPGCIYRSVDLLEKDAVHRAVADVKGVTHIYNAARFEHSTDKPEPADINTAMLAAVLEAAIATNQPLAHVHLVQGSKYYGSQLGPYPTPAREDDPRALQRNFYYEQEDMVIGLAARRGFTWSASRPHGVCDSDTGIARSMSLLIAVYAAVSKELELPLSFPGTPENFKALYQCTEACLLARAIHWMSVTQHCANQAFNVTNGDFIRWQKVWPTFADFFGMRVGAVRTISLHQIMPEMAYAWDKLAGRHQLRARPYADLVLWRYGDFLFRPGWDMVSDTSKLRRFGFHELVDTQAMFLDLFAHFRAERIVP